MLLLHLSDLHLSRYGESRLWTQSDESDDDWKDLQGWQRWCIQGRHDKRGKRDRLRLIDPEGVMHAARKWPKREEKAIKTLLALAMERHRTSAEALIKERPPPEDLDALIRLDRTNSNLRFIELLDNVLPLEPDIIVITGDITDNGFGYDLLSHYLAPWIEKRRLLVVPGNHDTYDMFPRRGRKARQQAKEARYQAFAEEVDCEPNEEGAYVRIIDDIAFIGLSSCKAPRTPLSVSGAVSREQLARLDRLGSDRQFSRARRRIALMHHHLLRMPFELGKRSPIEMGLRLRNAPQVMRSCTMAKIDLILHGHRHHGYSVQLPGHPTVVSSPSSTRGCKSSDMRYVWTLDLASRRACPRVHIFSDDPAAENIEEP